MRKTLSLFAMIGVVALAAPALILPGSAPPGPEGGDPLALALGQVITTEEAEAIFGGDVVMKLNADRTKLTVNVYINDQELRRLNPKPLKTIEMDAHNRIVDTTEAPYYPSKKDKKAPPAAAGLTTKPEAFPEGTWKVTKVKKTSAKYGPNMINTDAEGRVEVYAKGNKIGDADDEGYAIHSNSRDFKSSKSYGCVIIKKEDNETLAGILERDRSDAESRGSEGRVYQVINVR